MNHDQRVNPYQGSSSPEIAGMAPLAYLRAYGYIFDNPQWVLNVVFGALCVLSTSVIPVVGQLILLGYVFEIIEALHRDPRRTYPDFDFNRLANYLVRGVWPFLVSLVAAIVLIPVFVVVCGGMFAVIAVAARLVGEDALAILIPLGVLLMVAGIIAFSLLAGVVAGPAMLRAGLSQELAEGFNFEFTKDFICRVWKELLLAYLFLSLTSLLATLAGFVMLCVGTYAAVAIVMMAQGHLSLQLYELYLNRGGSPIPLKGGKE